MFTRKFDVNYRSYDIRVPQNVLEGEVLSYIKWQDLGYLYKNRLAIEVFKVKQGLNHRQNHFKSTTILDKDINFCIIKCKY